MASQANLLQNGSFESNTVIGNFGGIDDAADQWTKFTDLSANSSPDVWDNNGVGGATPGTSGFWNGFSAFDGTKFATIAGDPNQGPYVEGIESSAFNLTANTIYLLTARIAFDTDGPLGYNNAAPLRVRLRTGNLASTVLTDLGGNTIGDTWETRTYQFTAGTAGSYTMIFSEETTVKAYLALDDVSLVAVPEPMSLIALGAGIAGLLRSRRKR